MGILKKDAVVDCGVVGESRIDISSIPLVIARSVGEGIGGKDL